MKAETLVGLCADRSLEMVIGLLGILKSGGAYLPLDPEYPLSRLRFMVEDSSVPVIISQSRFRERLPERSAKMVCTDSQWEIIAAASDENPSGQIDPGDFAYVIYTSGSTGVPKGVVIEHRKWCKTLIASRDVFSISENDSLTNIASISFDVALWEQFLTLISGGKTILIGHEEVVDINRLIHRSMDASLFHAVPSLMEVWLNTVISNNQLSSYRRLRSLFVGGDAVPEELMGNLKRSFPHVDVIELYGPTENSILSTFRKFDETQQYHSFCIGQRFDHVQCYVLGKKHEMVPIGVPGELCLAGQTVARGYLNRPGLTSEKFITNPYGDKSSSLLYLTGDLVRCLPDGNFEFLGRIDNQVKLRGFRIELSEIEVSLSRHQSVQNAVVVIKKGKNPYLAAYVVLNESEKIKDFATEEKGGRKRGRKRGQARKQNCGFGSFERLA